LVQLVIQALYLLKKKSFLREVYGHIGGLVSFYVERCLFLLGFFSFISINLWANILACIFDWLFLFLANLDFRRLARQLLLFFWDGFVVVLGGFSLTLLLIASLTLF
jgi:hypothetical protein